MTAEGINFRVFKNSAALLASQVYIAFTSLFLATQLPRYLGPDGYGTYGEIYAFVGMFEVLGQFGLRIILTREIARNKGQALYLLGQVLTLKLPLAMLFATIVMAATLVRPTTGFERFLIGICIVESVVRGYSNAINSLLRAFEWMEYNLVITLVDRTLAVIAVLVAVYLHLDLTAIFVAFLISGLGRLLVTITICQWKAGAPTLGINWGVWKQFLRDSWPVGWVMAIEHTYLGIGLVILRIAHGATGLLAGALRINTLTLMLGTSLVEALFPVLARSTQRRQVARNGLSILLAMVFPIAAFYALYSNPFLRWFLGEEFAPASAGLVILSPAIVLGFIRSFFSSFLAVCNRQRCDALAMSIALVVNVTLDLLLIPRLDFIGAVWALVASESVYLVTILFLGRDVLHAADLGRAALPAALGVAGCVAVWKWMAVTEWIKLPLGIVLYVVLWVGVARLDHELWAFLAHLSSEALTNVRSVLRQFRP